MDSKKLIENIRVGQIWEAIQNPYKIQGLTWSITWEVGKFYKINKIVELPSNDKLVKFAHEGKTRGGWELSIETFLLGFRLIS